MQLHPYLQLASARFIRMRGKNAILDGRRYRVNVPWLNTWSVYSGFIGEICDDPMDGACA